jgi:uncharacterized membrane protein
MDKIKKEKILSLVLCVMGILAVAYGMSKENDPIFIIGLLFIIGGYLLIRRRLSGRSKSKQ